MSLQGTKTQLLDTRKTVPGLRVIDKYAVLCGGGVNHRLDLSDGILIKNNHISLGGGMEVVIAKALANRKPEQKIEVEVRSMAELETAVASGVDSLLVDNMTPDEVDEGSQVRPRSRSLHSHRSVGRHSA